MLAQILAQLEVIPPRGLVVAFVGLFEFVVLCAIAMTVLKTALSHEVYRRRRDVIKTAVALSALGLIALSLPGDAGADSTDPVVAADASR